MKKTSITHLRGIARRECANYHNKLCLGVMIEVKKSKKGTKLITWKDDDMAGGPCTVEKGCGYFDKIVTPGL